MLHDGVSKLIGAIYEAPYDDARWRQTVVDLLAKLDCRALLFSVVDAKHRDYSFISWVGADDARAIVGMEEYSNQYYQLDPTIPFAADNPLGRFCDVRSLVAPERHATDPYMRWYQDRFRSPHFAVCYTPPVDGLTFGLSVHPGHKDAVDYPLFQFLFNHVARSITLAARPPSLESATDAIVLVRGSGRVVALSAQAERYLALDDGIGLRDGYIVASGAADTQAISRAVSDASSPAVSGSSGAALFVTRPSYRRSWLLSVTPLAVPSNPAVAYRPAAMIRIIDPSRKHALSDQVCTLLGFTSRERQVADLLLAGHSPSTAARCLEISENTVKVHLQALYRKTQTNRQAEFIALLLEVS